MFRIFLNNKRRFVETHTFMASTGHRALVPLFGLKCSLAKMHETQPIGLATIEIGRVLMFSDISSSTAYPVSTSDLFVTDANTFVIPIIVTSVT